MFFTTHSCIFLFQWMLSLSFSLWSWAFTGSFLNPMSWLVFSRHQSRLQESNLLKHQCIFIDKLHILPPRIFKESLYWNSDIRAQWYAPTDHSLGCQRTAVEVTSVGGWSQTPMLNTAAQLRETSYPVPPSCSLTKPAGKIAAFLSAHVWRV